MFKDSSNQAEFELLIRATRHELFHFIIVQYQHLDLVRTVKNDLKAKYPERPFAEFNLENINPETFIHSILACKTGFVFIEKFELFFQEDLQALAIGYNQRRDLFSTLPIQLIVFVPFGGDTLLHFQKTMPDFYSILNLSISLKSENLPAENLQSRIPFDNTNNDYDNIEDAKKEIERIEKRLTTLEDIPENASLIYNLTIKLARAHRFNADYVKSKTLYEQLLSVLVKQNNPDLENVIIHIQNDLATLLQELGELNEAKTLLEKILRFDERRFGLEHPNTIITYSNLASTYKDLGDLEKAKTLSKKVLSLAEKHFGKNHSTTAIANSNLALVIKDLGDIQEAKKLLKRTLFSNEINFGKSHVNTAVSYSNLALVHIDLKEYEEAKILLNKALAINEKNFGVVHPSTAICYANLATVYANLGDYKTAKDLFEKALFSDISTFGENNPTVAIRCSNLGIVLMYLGDNERAKELLEKAYKIKLDFFGQEHPYTQADKSNLDFLNQQIASTNH
ncbi:tetratricopeptide (TPR) repeat protein [Arcicella rosea]|uniref:tetratricopeptide repeat protein n=1 Tax=Arcicella rosea TaxID=502909 RepID=UPI00345D6BA8